jgi:hypothetical protein
MLAKLLGKSTWGDGTPATMGSEKKQKNSTTCLDGAGNAAQSNAVIE